MTTTQPHLLLGGNGYQGRYQGVPIERVKLAFSYRHASLVGFELRWAEVATIEVTTSGSESRYVQARAANRTD
jgi:hypothetical protein